MALSVRPAAADVIADEAAADVIGDEAGQAADRLSHASLGDSSDYGAVDVLDVLDAAPASRPADSSVLASISLWGHSPVIHTLLDNRR